MTPDWKRQASIGGWQLGLRFAPMIAALLIVVPVVPATAQSGSGLPGSPTCGELFDMWDVPGVPPGTLAIGGLGRELIAANDCIMKNDVAGACAHLNNILDVAARPNSPLEAHRPEVVALMEQHDCAADPAEMLRQQPQLGEDDPPVNLRLPGQE